jgi:hypothetical protein
VKAGRVGVLDRDVAAGDSIPLERERVRLRAIDENYFSLGLMPGLVYYEGGAAEVRNTAGDALMMRLAAGVTLNFAARQTWARKLWVRTTPRILFWYTSPGGAVTNFDLRFSLKVFGTSSGLTSSVFATDFSVPGPAIANSGPLFASVLGGAVIPASPFGILQARLIRRGTDANANALDVLGAIVQFQEAP